MKHNSQLTPLAISRLGRAALIALPVLVARADAAPKTPASAPRTAVRSAKADVKIQAVSGQEARGAVFNRKPGQLVNISLDAKAKVSVTEGADVVHTSTRDGVMTVLAVKAGRAVIVVQRDGLAPQNYVFRVRETAKPATEVVALPELRVTTEALAQTADLSKPAASATAATATPVEAKPATATPVAATPPTAVTVTPATSKLVQAPPADVTVPTAPPAADATADPAPDAPTRTVTTTPVPVDSGTLAIGTGRQFDGVKVSSSLPAPSRMPRGTASYPTTASLPANIRAAAKTAPRNSIQVTQGLARLLQFRKNILSVFFSDVNVMDARAVNARTVAITGLVPGTSTLAVFSERFPGDAIGQPVIYQITVRAPAGPATIPPAAPNIESIETAIRTAIDDPRVTVSVIQSPGGTLTARLSGSVRDAGEIEGIKSTAALFVPSVVSTLYVDKESPSSDQARQPSGSAVLQETLRRITDNQTIELVDVPDGGAILKATVGSVEEANALMRLIPLRQRINPFIVVRSGDSGKSSVYAQNRPTLTGEDADMSERLQAVTGVRSVYVTRTAMNGLAVYGSVLNMAEYDIVRRYARILPQNRAGTSDREDNIPANFPPSADRYPLGVQMFVRILDGSQSVIRKVTVQTNVVEINRTALKNLGVEYGSATLLSESVTPASITAVPSTIPGVPPTFLQNPGTLTRTIDPTFNQGVSTLGNGFIGTGGFNNLDPFRARLNALYQRGNARILSAPNVTALNGSDAQITVGGSRPIPVAAASNGGVGVGVEFRRYGIIMTMRPTVTDDDTILLQIRADVTNIDTTTSINVNGAVIPGETTRSVNTTLNVHEGDIIVMGGLITNEQLRRTTKVPFLSQIPLLGSLFQSKRFENNETELAIFMTPTIQRSTATMNTIEMAERARAMAPLPTNDDGGSGATIISGSGGR